MAKATNPLQRALDKFKGEAETHRKRADELAGQIRQFTQESELTKALTGLKVRGEAGRTSSATGTCPRSATTAGSSPGPT